jgi:hypothetical protein
LIISRPASPVSITKVPASVLVIYTSSVKAVIS